MNNHRFLRLPNGKIKGPFPLEKVKRAVISGQVPPGSALAESEHGPWEPIESHDRQPKVEHPTVQWHVAIRGERQGPLSEPRVLAMAESGELAPTDLVWSKGMAAWTPAADVSTLAGAFNLGDGPPPLPPSGPAAFAAPRAEHPGRTGNGASAGNPRGASDDIWAIVALAVPVISIGGLWMWISNLRVIDVLQSNPQQAFLLVEALTIIVCGVLVGLDAAKIGIGGPDDLNAKGQRRANGPAHWGIFVALLFLIGYPSYMAIRSLRGVRNLIIAAILSMSGFIVGSMFLYAQLSAALRQKGLGG